MNLKPETMTKIGELSSVTGVSVEELLDRIVGEYKPTGFYPDDFSWKKFEFVTTVQTAMIHNAINISLEPDAIGRRAEFSSTAAIFQMAEAFRAADRIPEELTARQAAHAFAHWLLHNETDPGARMPSWFGLPTQEDNDRWDRGEEER